MGKSPLIKGVSEETLNTQEDILDYDVSEAIQPTATTAASVAACAVMREGNIGSLLDESEAPLLYSVRLLVSRFLLTGHPEGLVPDRQVGEDAVGWLKSVKRALRIQRAVFASIIYTYH